MNTNLALDLEEETPPLTVPAIVQALLHLAFGKIIQAEHCCVSLPFISQEKAMCALEEMNKHLLRLPKSS